MTITLGKLMGGRIVITKAAERILLYTRRDMQRSLPRLAALIILGTGLAWANRWVQDDAYISFRYAQNLIEGHGLVWNVVGERVEGYSNFLWTLLIAAFMRFGVHPASAAVGLGLTFFVGTL